MKPEIKNQIQEILFTLQKILKHSDNSAPNATDNLSKSISLNRANAFKQLCFYAKYKNSNSSQSDIMDTDYLKWKAIYDSYNNPLKVLYDLNENKLTKKQYHAIINHFLSSDYFKSKDKTIFLSQTQKLIEKKLLNTK